MRPYKYEYKSKGYCCFWDDGPYSKWRRKVRRIMRKQDRQRAKREIERERRDE